jgi:hypothetical protein
LKLVSTAGGNTDSPYNIEGLVEARLGTLQVGQFLQGLVSPYGTQTGLLGAPIYVSATVIST